MKKIISMVLALVMVFAIGATTFAATSVSSVPTHEHEWSEWEDKGDTEERYCEICGITEVRYTDGVEGEANPETGASAAIGMAVLVSAAAAASFKRK